MTHRAKAGGGTTRNMFYVTHSPGSAFRCRGGEGETCGGGGGTDALRMKRMSQIRPAVWCKGRIQVLVEVAMKGREPPWPNQIFTVPGFHNDATPAALP